MRIVVDLDGVICPIRKSDQKYAELQPVAGAVERLKELRAAGHSVIIQTARHMKTCDGNVGLVIKRLGKVTLDWLEEHDIEYDEIFFGKPHGEVYLDDRGLRFEAWAEVTDERLEQLAKEK